MIFGSYSLIALSNFCTSQISISSKLYFGFEITFFNEFKLPAYVNLSTFSTKQPIVFIKYRTTADPIKPAPPVTNIFLSSSFILDLA